MTKISLASIGSTISAALLCLSCGPIDPGDEALLDEWESDPIAQTREELTVSTLPGFPFHHLPLEIMNVWSGKCLDVGNAGTAAGEDVVQFNCHAGNNQSWFLVKIAGNDYQVRAGHAPGMNLDIEGGSLSNGAGAQIYGGTTDAQVFNFSRQSDGSYLILSKKSGKCLRVASTGNSVRVEQSTCSTTSLGYRWWIRHRTNAFNLVAKHSEKCLDIAGASTANRANVQQYPCARQENQRFYALDVEAASNGNAYFEIRANHSDQCLDVASGSFDSGANVQQYPCNGGDNQRWLMTEHSDGFTRIRNKRSGKCLDVKGASGASNANIQQFTCNGNHNQRFYWANFARRHIHLVRVADKNGNGRLPLQDSNVQAYVTRTNTIFRRYGLELVYDPTVDKTSINSDAFFKLGDSGTFTCPNADGSSGPTTGTAEDCANRYAANFPDKIVVINRPGNGFSGGSRNFIAIGELHAGTACSSAVPDTQWLAHEVGHYMGIAHTFYEASAINSVSDAEALLQMNADDPSIFDGDFLGDTRPNLALPGTDCLAPTSATGTIALQGAAGPVTLTVDTDNVMAYYYNSGARITTGQAAVARATSYARVF